MCVIRFFITVLIFVGILSMPMPFFVKAIGMAIVLAAVLKRKKLESNFKKNKDDVEFQEERPKLSKTKEIFYIAERFNNRLTVEEMVLHSTNEYDFSKKTLNELSKKGVIASRMTDKGIIVYEFPEMPFCPKVMELKGKSNDDILKNMLMIAGKSDKKLSVAGVARCTDLEIDDIIKLLDNYTDKKICEKYGKDLVYYEFPGILSEDEREQAEDIWR
ncbi:MAG: hypothetical protein JXR48_07255 [Candidatus Delongbacteria bacterium]|nr:hypothetical protein [Candidatus Delongbacteria bacterium]MBN2834749.1 hypothetical protein [Candidatus Delongbacteria bacterium]